MKLKQVLAQMLKEARTHPERPIVRSLAYASKLEITQHPDGTVQLTIERFSAVPTETDWQQITSQWPEHLPADVVPTSHREGRRYSMTGRWARPAGITEAAA